MSAPPVMSVMTPVRERITEQCNLVASFPAVRLSPPITKDPTEDILCYALHLAAPEDTLKAAGGVMQRLHRIELRLWMRTPDDTTEEAFLAFGDAISSAFFQDQRLGGVADQSTLKSAARPPYIRIGAITYRQRVWSLEVVQRFQVTME